MKVGGNILLSVNESKLFNSMENLAQGQIKGVVTEMQKRKRGAARGGDETVGDE